MHSSNNVMQRRTQLFFLFLFLDSPPPLSLPFQKKIFARSQNTLKKYKRFMLDEMTKRPQILPIFLEYNKFAALFTRSFM